MTIAVKMESATRGCVDILAGGNDMRGDRWGIEGPPKEAYSRVTNPERFQPLHGAATGLLDRLERGFAVERLEGPDADDELGSKSLARPAIRLTPHDSQAAPIVVAFSEFPRLHVRFGSWRTEPFPNCGCDACDETADGSIEEMIRMVEAVVSGGFREAMRVPPLLGDGWQESEFRFDDGHGGFSRSRGRVSRSRALEITGGKLNVTLEWKPWPLRNATAAPTHR
jgi:hypothetical protein